MNNDDFIDKVWNFYHANQRPLPWRTNTSPYSIVVSELMLQQTQVGRVIEKYEQFLKLFPSFADLASAPQSEVLEAWSGLGYNRRAKFLHQTAQIVTTQHKGVLPETIDDLVALPGIGYNTAAAIMAYAFNKAHPFIETNIRTVYIYEFFGSEVAVSDAELTPLIQATLDVENPREWYWALMDYGTYIKKEVGNIAKNSKHYVKQSKFEGSRRQIRGKILKMLVDGPRSNKDLKKAMNDPRYDSVIADLLHEGFVVIEANTVMLKQ